jgi:hypothetical protein
MSRHNVDSRYVNMERYAFKFGPSYAIKRIFNKAANPPGLSLHGVDITAEDTPRDRVISTTSVTSVTSATPSTTSKHKKEKDQGKFKESLCPVGWVTDASVGGCMHCGKAFGLLRPRRHHCRMCGDVVCRVSHTHSHTHTHTHTLTHLYPLCPLCWLVGCNHTSLFSLYIYM